MRIRSNGLGRRSMAAKAERHDLYERSVQDPPTEVELVARTFKRIRKRNALTIREDFCGTAVFSLAWADSHPERQAWGIDLDQPTLDWGYEHRISRAEPEVAKRVNLLCENVLAGKGPKTDITVAFNFSYWLFETRELLRAYFKTARKGLKKDGLFFLDCFGGTEVPMADDNRRRENGFVYRWEQEFFDALTHHFKCAIHFEFPDGSSIERAFQYEWRFWTLPEIRELLLEAGFSRVRILWERTDEDGEGTGAYYEPKNADNEGLWWAYIIAEP